MCSDTVSKNVTIVGIFYGEGKPGNCNAFLDKFVHEAIDLINNGILFNNYRYNVRLKTLICDAPAKAYVLQVKNHTGFNSCTKCVIEGEFIDNRVTFRKGANKILRTNELFRNYAYNLITNWVKLFLHKFHILILLEMFHSITCIWYV